MAELAGKLFSSEATPAKNVSSYGLAEWVSLGKGKLDAATPMAYSHVKPTGSRVWLWRVWVGGKRRRQSGVWSQRSLSALTHLSFKVTECGCAGGSVWPDLTSGCLHNEIGGALGSSIQYSVCREGDTSDDPFKRAGYPTRHMWKVCCHLTVFCTHRTAWHVCDCEKRHIRMQFTECSVNMCLVTERKSVCQADRFHTVNPLSQDSF